ncbi:MAG: hypothetical protein K2R98_30045, partial [Gemmataceae bacterium]|nr:hypothetical protein [Gemmataceae bacterium]
MFHRFNRLAWGSALASLMLLSQHPAGAADEAGIAVQARGPVHEAFAQPNNANPAPTPVVPKKPPEPIPEEPPEQKPEGDTVTWMPGYWAWDADQNDFLWVSGFWRVPPPQRRWVPGYWNQAGDGWQWVPGFWASNDQDDLPYQPAPPASLDRGPATPAPDDNQIYVPGCWVYRQLSYVWKPGYWIAAQADWVFTPASYRWTPAGSVFVNGFWDYPLEDRGVLFAPVFFTQPLWNNSNWRFTPQYSCNLAGLLGSLFVQPANYSYCFGDYYGGGYAQRGIVPWIGWGGNTFDPLYSYYNWAGGGSRGWFGGLGNIYAGRMRGDIDRPPRTFAQQQNIFNQTNIERNNTSIRNSIVNNVSNDVNIRNNNRVNIDNRERLSQVVRGNTLQTLDRNRGSDDRNGRQTKLTETQRRDHNSAARQTREFAQQRSQTERQAAAQNDPRGGRGDGSPARLKLPPVGDASRANGAGRSPSVNGRPASPGAVPSVPRGDRSSRPDPSAARQSGPRPNGTQGGPNGRPTAAPRPSTNAAAPASTNAMPPRRPTPPVASPAGQAGRQNPLAQRPAGQAERPQTRPAQPEAPRPTPARPAAAPQTQRPASAQQPAIRPPAAAARLPQAAPSPAARPNGAQPAATPRPAPQPNRPAAAPRPAPQAARPTAAPRPAAQAAPRPAA